MDCIRVATQGLATEAASFLSWRADSVGEPKLPRF